MIPVLVENAQHYEWGINAIERALKATRERSRAVDREGPDREEMDEKPQLKHFPKEPRPRKRRVPWEPDEEKTLLNAIDKYGPKWADIEAKYGRSKLYGRDQMAIKDKARNIMRRIVDSGHEDDWYQRHPNWAGVTVGNARRGVHGYEPGIVPKKRKKFYDKRNPFFEKVHQQKH